MPSVHRTLGAALSAALLFAASEAHAHSFGAGTDAFASFVEGANAVLFSPISLLPCLSLGLLLTLWQVEGMLKAWPVLFIGHVIGFVLAPQVGLWVIPALEVLGAAIASLAALLPRHMKAEVYGLSFVTGLMTMLVSLEGHAWMELAWTIYLGIFVAASFAVAAGAGLARLALEQITSQWTIIAIRVAASWLAAMQLLMAAFLFNTGG